LTGFTLHPVLAADTRAVDEWSLSSLRLMDDARFPWLILVPRVEGATQVQRLEPRDRSRLCEEMVRAAAALEREVAAHVVNVAALGNVVPQLHVHVVARFPGDAAWPGPVWGVPGRERYSEAEAARWVERLRRALG